MSTRLHPHITCIWDDILIGLGTSVRAFKPSSEAFQTGGECTNHFHHIHHFKITITTLSDSNSSTSDLEDSYDEEGNFSAFMTIAHVESSEDLNLLVQELGEHSDEEFMGIVEESDAKEDEDIAGLQENYNSLIEKSGEYTKVAKVAAKATVKKTEES